MPAQKRPLPSSAAADVEEAHPGPGADADGARRSPKPTLNGAEERDGWKRQGKDRRHGVWPSHQSWGGRFLRKESARALPSPPRRGIFVVLRLACRLGFVVAAAAAGHSELCSSRHAGGAGGGRVVRAAAAQALPSPPSPGIFP
nr:unnamed protein product [Digitaria exilis]